jgi:hypothetical protein
MERCNKERIKRGLKPCKATHVCNPETGRCVKKDSAKGKQILKQYKSKTKRSKSATRKSKSVKKSKSKRKSVKKSKTKRKSVRKSKSRKSYRSKSVLRNKKSLKLIKQIRNMNCVRDMELAKLGEEYEKIKGDIYNRELDLNVAMQKSVNGADKLERGYHASLAADIQKDIDKLKKAKEPLEEKLKNINDVDELLKKAELSVNETRKVKYLISKLDEPFKSRRMKKFRSRR